MIPARIMEIMGSNISTLGGLGGCRVLFLEWFYSCRKRSVLCIAGRGKSSHYLGVSNVERNEDGLIIADEEYKNFCRVTFKK